MHMQGEGMRAEGIGADLRACDETARLDAVAAAAVLVVCMCAAAAHLGWWHRRGGNRHQQVEFVLQQLLPERGRLTHCVELAAALRHLQQLCWLQVPGNAQQAAGIQVVHLGAAEQQAPRLGRMGLDEGQINCKAARPQHAWLITGYQKILLKI